MKKTPFIILTLALTLSACAPTATATPVPATETPLPTETPIPSPMPLPLTWVSAENGEGIELPADLFGLVKDRNPLLSAEGAQILNAETNEVLLEKKDGEWMSFEERKSYERITLIYDFKDSYVPYDEILDGSLYEWVMREVMPNVEFNENSIVGTEDIQVWGDPFRKYMLGYPRRIIKGVAYLSTKVGDSYYRVMVNVYEGENGEKLPVILVAGYSGQSLDMTNDFWNDMTAIPIVLNSEENRGSDDPFVVESQKLLGDNITLDDLRAYIPQEEIDRWNGIDAPIGTLWAFLDKLTPEQLAEFEPGEGGVWLAFYMLKHGDPSFMSMPGLVFETFPARGELFNK